MFHQIKIALTNYEMQMANSKLNICLALNAYFFPNCNGNITWIINDIVKEFHVTSPL